MTEAPDASDVPAVTDLASTMPDDSTESVGTTIDGLVAEWRAELDGQTSVSASTVQDHLLDLWGRLPEGESRDRIERWLTETLQRNLYQVTDIDERLAGVLPADS